MQPLRQSKIFFTVMNISGPWYLVFKFEYVSDTRLRWDRIRILSCLILLVFHFIYRNTKSMATELKQVGCIEASLIFAERRNLVLTIFWIWIVKILKFVQNNLGKKDVGNNLKLGCQLPSGENLCNISSGVKIVVKYIFWSEEAWKYSDCLCTTGQLTNLDLACFQNLL